MKKSSVRLLLTAAALLLIAGTLFRFAQSWIYAGLSGRRFEFQRRGE